MGWTAADIPPQTGRVAVVTGGNGGLGLETTTALTAAGAHVVIAARDLDKAASARHRLMSAMPDASLEVVPLDLASLVSVTECAHRILASHHVVDLLFDNAGVMACPEGVTADGFETQFGCNHLGHFALTMRLLPALLRAPAARVVSTSSSARYMAGGYDLANPHHRGTYGAWSAYGLSKRANLQFALELNRRMAEAGTRVTAYAADPGGAKTDLQPTSVALSGGLSQKASNVLVGLFGQSAAMGALPQLRAGTDPAAEGGTLYAPRWFMVGAPVPRRVESFLRRPDEMRRLWEISEEETGLTLADALA